MIRSVTADAASLHRPGCGPLGRWRRAAALACCVAAAIVALARPAGAQTPPAGNAHPQTRMLEREGFVNPFGTPPPTATMTTERKLAFAREVNLAPLRDLAVYHSGRVKILDSLARETVADITGRRNFQDLVPETPGDPETRYRKVGYDPLFTLLDFVIDPSYYADKPLVGVNYLPLRKAILNTYFPPATSESAAAVPDQPAPTSGSSSRSGDAPPDPNADIRETWLRLGRVTPQMVAATFQTISSGGQIDPSMQRGLNEVHGAVALYLRSAANLNLIPAASRDDPWRPLAETAPGTPLGDAVRRLGEAWRAGDAAGVNAAAAVLAAELPKLNPAVYPTTRRDVERVYNASSPFEWGAWLYAGALVSLLLAFGTQRGWLKITGATLLLAAVGIHAAGFAARCYVAERFAIQNQFESMTGVSLFAAVVGLTLALARRQWLFGAAVAAVGFMVLVTATQTAIPGKDINREAAILNTSILLKYHVTTVLFSYGLISLGFVVSLFYLATHYMNRFRAAPATAAAPAASSGAGLAPAPGTAAGISAAALGIDSARARGPVRVLADLDTAQMTILQLAFWTLGVGILLGAWWADHSWGRWWAFDPKELWALLTWIVYLVVIHLRVAGLRDKGFITAWLSVVGFIVMLWCYFGVNLLLPGLHAYA